jgi:hypothetical protein
MAFLPNLFSPLLLWDAACFDHVTLTKPAISSEASVHFYLLHGIAIQKTTTWVSQESDLQVENFMRDAYVIYTRRFNQTSWLLG